MCSLGHFGDMTPPPPVAPAPQHRGLPGQRRGRPVGLRRDGVRPDVALQRHPRVRAAAGAVCEALYEGGAAGPDVPPGGAALKQGRQEQEGGGAWSLLQRVPSSLCPCSTWR